MIKVIIKAESKKEEIKIQAVTTKDLMQTK